ncbi:MAG: hypothetical protein PVI99_00060 [Anaerolineales bacterium]|jgi:hypothetical protein
MDQEKLVELKKQRRDQQTCKNNGTSPDEHQETNTITIVVNSENYQVEIEIY